MERCDLSAAKILVQSRDFEHIKIGDDMHKGWKKFRIATEKFSSDFDSFQGIINNSCHAFHWLCIDSSIKDIGFIPVLFTRFVFSTIIQLY